MSNFSMVIWEVPSWIPFRRGCAPRRRVKAARACGGGCQGSVVRSRGWREEHAGRGGGDAVAFGLPVGLRGASQPGGVGHEREYLRSHGGLSVPSDSCHDDGTG